jgi:hypothetical protein
MSKKDKKADKETKKSKKAGKHPEQAMTEGEMTAAYIASQLTRGRDAMYGAERRAMLSDLAATGGLTDIGQGAEMLAAASDLTVMTAAVHSLNEDDLADTMAIAAISGELAVLADVVADLDLPLISEFLFERSEQLREMAAANIARFGTLRLLSESIEDAAEDIGEMGDDEVAEGVARLDLADAAMASSETMAATGEAMIAEGLATLAAAYGAAEIEGLFDLALFADEEE